MAWETDGERTPLRSHPFPPNPAIRPDRERMRSDHADALSACRGDRKDRGWLRMPGPCVRGRSSTRHLPGAPRTWTVRCAFLSTPS